MNFFTKLATTMLIASTYASAWILTGTVDSITQQDDGAVRIQILKDDSSIVKNKLIVTDDVNKKEKIAILLTAKTSKSTVSLDITGSTIGNVTIQ